MIAPAKLSDLDRIVAVQQGLRFVDKLCIFDSELIPNSIIYPL